jgi:hypothetical protein
VLNRIGGETFANILVNYQKKLLENLVSILEYQLIELINNNNGNEELVEECQKISTELIEAIEPLIQNRAKFSEHLHKFAYFLIEFLRIHSSSSSSSSSSSFSELSSTCQQQQQQQQKQKASAYQCLRLLIESKVLRLSQFVFEFWPKLEPIWLKDFHSMYHGINGSLTLASCLVQHYYHESSSGSSSSSNNAKKEAALDQLCRLTAYLNEYLEINVKDFHFFIYFHFHFHFHFLLRSRAYKFQSI